MKKGFTLLELIVVIIIIAIIAGLGIPQYIRVAEKAKQAEGLRLLGALRQSQQRYFARYSVYAIGAAALPNLDVTLSFRYFNLIDLNGDETNPDIYLAQVTRANVEKPTAYDYDLFIYPDGRICYNDAAGGACETATVVAAANSRPGL